MVRVMLIPQRQRVLAVGAMLLVLTIEPAVSRTGAQNDITVRGIVQSDRSCTDGRFHRMRLDIGVRIGNETKDPLIVYSGSFGVGSISFYRSGELITWQDAPLVFPSEGEDFTRGARHPPEHLFQVLSPGGTIDKVVSVVTYTRDGRDLLVPPGDFTISVTILPLGPSHGHLGPSFADRWRDVGRLLHRDFKVAVNYTVRDEGLPPCTPG